MCVRVSCVCRGIAGKQKTFTTRIFTGILIKTGQESFHMVSVELVYPHFLIQTTERAQDIWSLVLENPSGTPKKGKLND